MEPDFSAGSINPERARRRQQRRFRRVPINILLPNAVTLLGLTAGLTAIRFAVEGRFPDAALAILVAALLDALDGRIARLLRGTSRFGAELDSLADIVNFGVAPAVVLYAWSLNGLGALGWIVAMVFAVCCALRLARFNVALEDPDRPSWMAQFFVGVPAPAGALLVLLPLYLTLLDIPAPPFGAGFTLVFTAVVAMLMVSRLPTFSAKMMGQRVRRDMVLPGLVIFAVFAGVLASYTWQTLAVCSLVYLLAIPFAAYRHRQYAAGRRSLAEPKTEPDTVPDEEVPDEEVAEKE
jgi:CDP-diacylglycerol--serine O-phosphatidyltransferase